MLISWNWLGRHVDLDGLSPEVVGHQFTLRVAELDAITEVGGGLEGVRTVRVESVEPVEGSDHLSKVVVQDGEKTLSVVCGAPNAPSAVGKVCVLVPAGTTLPDGKEITQATIRGVESCGMLASEAELGLSDEHEGIIVFDSGVEPGKAFTEAVPVHDWVWEVDNKAITHRPDLWGHRGIAREVALLVERPFKPQRNEPEFGQQDLLKVTVAAPELCPRYTTAYFTSVEVKASPQWLQCLLRATGIRPISNVVDLTNYVMLDVGNPMHAFDARFVAGNTIDVRRATDGEVIRTLDGQDRICTNDTLLICDGEKPVAIAGVMGGENSEIRDDTTEVILEAANFDPGSIRRTSVRLGLRTESSTRFEKALDPEAAEAAAKLFTELMVALAGANVVSPLVDVRAPASPPSVITLDPKVVAARLGVDVSIGTIRQVLSGLGFDVQDRSSGELKVGVPTWRATRDVAIAEDLIEEVGRFHGYVNIPPRAPRVQVQRPNLSPAKTQERAAREFLSSVCGMNEVLSYGFTWRPMLERLGADGGGRLELANTISAEMDTMRRSLVPNLLKFAEENARYFDHYGLYEVGRCFEPVAGELPIQDRRASWVQVHPKGDAEAIFRDAKGVLSGLLERCRAKPATYRRPTAEEIGWRSAWVHPQRSVVGLIDGQVVALLSILHPRAAEVLDDLKGVCTFGEVNLDRLVALGSVDHGFTPIPRFPAIRFDVSFEVAETVTAATLSDAIRTSLSDVDWLEGLELFANYHLGDGKKSVSFRLTFRASDRSLKDKAVNKATQKMIAAVSKQTNATLRGG